MYSNYGDISNEMLLFAYGFALPPNNSRSTSTSSSASNNSDIASTSTSDNEYTEYDRVAVTLSASPEVRLGTFYLYPSDDLSGIPKVLYLIYIIVCVLYK